MTERALRFGIMCRGTTFPAWQARSIGDLLALPGLEPALLIVDGDRERASWPERVRARVSRRDLLWAAYKRIFADRSAGTRPVDLAGLLEGVPSLTCVTSRRGRYSEYFSDEDVAAIRESRLDFILRFAFGIIRGQILGSARYGVWSFHHGDERTYRGGPPAFWEIVRGEPVTGAILQRLTERLDGGVVLHRGAFRTVGHSYVANRDGVFMGSADWPARVCRDIRAGTAGYLDAPPSSTESPLYRNPSARYVARFVARMLSNAGRQMVRRLTGSDRWTIGIADAPIESFLSQERPVAVRWMPPIARGRYLADPFFVSNGDPIRVLVEEFDYRDRRGRIAMVQWRHDGTVTERRVVLDPSPHASYPSTFEHDGSRYCVPETAGARRVDLFRMDGKRWVRVSTLLEDFAAVDPTVFRHEGTWWLFCTDRDRGSNTKLHAWHAAELSGPWVPHAANPLKTDVRSSRPAGTPFAVNGRLYRPAQDATVSYGGRVVINEVTRLTPTEFDEHVVAVVGPDPAGPCPDGLHTISAAGSMTLLDGNRRTFVPRDLAHQLRVRLRGAAGGREAWKGA